MELYKLIALVNGFNYVGMLPIMLWLPVIFQYLLFESEKAFEKDSSTTLAIESLFFALLLVVGPGYLIGARLEDHTLVDVTVMQRVFVVFPTIMCTAYVHQQDVFGDYHFPILMFIVDVVGALLHGLTAPSDPDGGFDEHGPTGGPWGFRGIYIRLGKHWRNTPATEHLKALRLESYVGMAFGLMAAGHTAVTCSLALSVMTVVVAIILQYFFLWYVANDTTEKSLVYVTGSRICLAGGLLVITEFMGYTVYPLRFQALAMIVGAIHPYLSAFTNTISSLWLFAHCYDYIQIHHPYNGPVYWLTTWGVLTILSSLMWLWLFYDRYDNTQKTRVLRVHFQDWLLGFFCMGVGAVMQKADMIGRGSVGSPVGFLLPPVTMWFTLETKFLNHMKTGTPFHPSWWVDGDDRSVPRFDRSDVVNLSFSIATALITVVLTSYAFFAVTYAVDFSAFAWEARCWKFAAAHGILFVFHSGIWMIIASSGVPAMGNAKALKILEIPPILKSNPHECIKVHKQDLVVGIVLLILAGFVLPSEPPSVVVSGVIKGVSMFFWVMTVFNKIRVHVKTWGYQEPINQYKLATTVQKSEMAQSIIDPAKAKTDESDLFSLPAPVEDHELLDHAKAIEQGQEERMKHAAIRRIQREWVKKSLRKRQQNLKMKSTDEGAGDLVPWSFQTYRLWCHPSSKFNDPTMYNAIAGELFGITIIAMLILTSFVDPSTFTDNPLRARLGYNNVCVALDQRPMRQISACGYMFIHWATIQYSLPTIARIRMERKTGKLRRQPEWVDSVLIFMHVVAILGSAIFCLCFVHSPEDNVYMHTRPFFGYIVGKWFGAAALTIEAYYEQDPKIKARQMVNWKTWTYVVVLGLVSGLAMLNVELNYAKYDIVHPEGWSHGDSISKNLWSPWWVSFILDWFWMILNGSAGAYLPRPPMTFGESVVHQDTIDELRHRFPPKADHPLEKKDFDPTAKVQNYHETTMRSAVRSALRYTIEAFEKKGEDEIKKDPTSQSDWGFGRTVTIMKAKLKIDDRIKKISPIFRTGLFKGTGEYDGFVRINITEHGAARFSIRIFVPNEDFILLDEADHASSRPGYKQVDFLMAEGFKQFFVHDIFVLASLMQTVYGLCSALRLLFSPIQTYHAIMGVFRAKAGIDNTTGIFGKEYYAGLPFMLGPGACKWGIKPKQDHIVDQGDIPGACKGASLTGIESEVTDKAASAMLKDLGAGLLGMRPREWDFTMQLAKCHPSHDLKDGACEWDEGCSPYLPVGTFTIFPEPAHEGGILNEDGPPLNFNAWNQLKEHRPVGPLQLARLLVYRRHRKARLAQSHKGKHPDLVCPFMSSF